MRNNEREKCTTRICELKFKSENNDIYISETGTYYCTQHKTILNVWYTFDNEID